MSRVSISGIFAGVLALGLVVVAGAQVDLSKPIVIKTLKPRIEKFRGEVLSATPVAITVRSRENELVIRAFSYSPKLREQMQKIIDQGNYQYGDRVEIQYESGSDVAFRIKGKPSKPH